MEMLPMSLPSSKPVGGMDSLDLHSSSHSSDMWGLENIFVDRWLRPATDGMVTNVSKSGIHDSQSYHDECQQQPHSEQKQTSPQVLVDSASESPGPKSFTTVPYSAYNPRQLHQQQLILGGQRQQPEVQPQIQLQLPQLHPIYHNYDWHHNNAGQTQGHHKHRGYHGHPAHHDYHWQQDDYPQAEENISDLSNGGPAVWEVASPSSSSVASRTLGSAATSAQHQSLPPPPFSVGSFADSSSWWQENVFLGRLSALARRYCSVKTCVKPLQAWRDHAESRRQIRKDKHAKGLNVVLQMWHCRALNSHFRREAPLARALTRLACSSLQSAWSQMRRLTDAWKEVQRGRALLLLVRKKALYNTACAFHLHLLLRRSLAAIWANAQAALQSRGGRKRQTRKEWNKAPGFQSEYGGELQCQSALVRVQQQCWRRWRGAILAWLDRQQFHRLRSQAAALVVMRSKVLSSIALCHRVRALQTQGFAGIWLHAMHRRQELGGRPFRRRRQVVKRPTKFIAPQGVSDAEVQRKVFCRWTFAMSTTPSGIEGSECALSSVMGGISTEIASLKSLSRKAKRDASNSPLRNGVGNGAKSTEFLEGFVSPDKIPAFSSADPMSAQSTMSPLYQQGALSASAASQMDSLWSSLTPLEGRAAGKQMPETKQPSSTLWSFGVPTGRYRDTKQNEATEIADPPHLTLLQKALDSFGTMNAKLQFTLQQGEDIAFDNPPVRSPMKPVAWGPSVLKDLPEPLEVILSPEKVQRLPSSSTDSQERAAWDAEPISFGRLPGPPALDNLLSVDAALGAMASGHLENGWKRPVQVSFHQDASKSSKRRPLMRKRQATNDDEMDGAGSKPKRERRNSANLHRKKRSPQESAQEPFSSTHQKATHGLQQPPGEFDELLRLSGVADSPPPSRVPLAMSESSPTMHPTSTGNSPKSAIPADGPAHLKEDLAFAPRDEGACITHDDYRRLRQSIVKNR